MLGSELGAVSAGSMTTLEPHQWRAWAVDISGRRPGRLALRSITLHTAPAASFTWSLAELPQVGFAFSPAALLNDEPTSGSTMLRSVTLHIVPAASFTWSLVELPKVQIMAQSQCKVGCAHGFALVTRFRLPSAASPGRKADVKVRSDLI